MNATEKRLARLNAQRHSSPDYSLEAAVKDAMQSYNTLEGYDFYKSRAYLLLQLGDLERAIFCTQVALWIMRIRKLAAPYVFNPKPPIAYVWPTGHYDKPDNSECDLDNIHRAESIAQCGF